MEAPCLSSSGDADPGVGRWPLSRCSRSLLVEASMICSFHLNLLSCFSQSSPWPVEGLISDSGPDPGPTLICFFLFVCFLNMIRCE